MKKILLTLLLVAVCITLSAQVTITMEQEAGVYKVPCVVNGAKMKFIFDTGAATVCLSESMAEYLLDNDYISKEDFVGTGTSTVADGRTVNHLKIILKDIEIGGLHLKDVEASIVEGQRASLLLGQTAIQKLGKVSIDGNQLIIERGIEDDCQPDKSGETIARMIEVANSSWCPDFVKGTYYLRLGNCYYYGNCVSVDYTTAADWYEKAAINGNAEGMTAYANCLYDGLGRGKDYSAAVYWYKKAAEKDEPFALYSLGEMYRRGQGVEVDMIKGFDYARLAVVKSDEDFTDARTAIVPYFEYFLQLAKQGNTTGFFYSGLCYANGYGTTQNFKEALYWYERGAEQGDYASMNNVAAMYEAGEGGIKKDMITAMYWYKQAAKENVVAQTNLGKKYYYGNESLKPDYVESLFWFQQAAKQGDIDAQLWIANYYQYGIGVQKNMMTALEKYTDVLTTLEDKYNIRRADDEIVLLYNRAAYCIGVIYANGGDGVDKDINKAIDYWEWKCYKYGYANYELYLLFQEGKEVPKDIKRAQNNLSANWIKAKWKSTAGLNALAYEYAKGTNGWSVQWDSAHKVIDDAIKLAPNNPNYYDTKGELYSMQGKYNEAKEMWHKVKAIDSTFYTKFNTELNKYIQKQTK